MLHVRAMSRSTLFVAAPLMALLHGCVMDGGDPMAPDLASAEQALAADLPHLGPALVPALALSAPDARHHDQPGGDLFALARGRWVGDCEILVPGQEEPVLTVEMERITEPTGTPGEYTWTIIYRGPDFEQVRPYTILADPATPGRYVVDEHNGILLPSYLVNGNILVSEFEVQGIRLMTREVFNGKKYDFEITTLPTTPELSSDLGDGFVVDSFRVATMQKCKLRRQRR
jgi:hypothetical protein